MFAIVKASGAVAATASLTVVAVSKVDYLGHDFELPVIVVSR